MGIVRDHRCFFLSDEDKENRDQRKQLLALQTKCKELNDTIKEKEKIIQEKEDIIREKKMYSRAQLTNLKSKETIREKEKIIQEKEVVVQESRNRIEELERIVAEKGSNDDLRFNSLWEMVNLGTFLVMK